MPGDGKLTITGQLGDVMRESAQAALSWVRGHLRQAPAEARPRTGSPPTTSTSTCPPAPSPRTGPRRASRWRSRSARSSTGKPVSLGRGDDRRGDAHGPGAADRRPQGEGARRPAGRDQAGDRPGPERGRRRGDPGPRARRDSSSSCWTRSRRPWRLRFEIGRAVAGIFPGICCADEPTTDEGVVAMAAKSTRADKARQAAQSGGLEPVRAAADRGPGAARQRQGGIRRSAARLRADVERQGARTGRVTEDKKVQRDLRTAAENLRDASERLRGKRRKKRHPCRKLLLIGIVAACSRSPSARICARPSSTGCSAPRRSSSTPRRRRPLRLPPPPSSTAWPPVRLS